ncbi:MAG: glycoside hydrolase family 15 protein [Planctomycetes bacterium]|nr:glycoside hydrolase family 15 protein [Planctomycetota bacterium]MBI3847362.1 glycoside hydrolase family 15 protein [Planctomycetota bacterium]
MPRDLPIGNGTVLVNFDTVHHVVRDIYFPSVGLENHTIGHRQAFGVWVDGQFAWIWDGWTITRRYETDTLVTNVVARHDVLGIELRIRDAVDFHLWAYLREIDVTDFHGQDREVRLFFHLDLHISGSEVGDTAHYDPVTQSVVHYKGARYFLHGAAVEGRPGIHQWACGAKEINGAEGTWRDAEDGRLEGNPIAQGAVDSTVGVTVRVPAFGTSQAHYWLVFHNEYRGIAKLDQLVKEKGPSALIHRTAAYWRVWLNREDWKLAGLPERGVRLFKHSLLVLRTQIDNGGAIIAANDHDITQFARDTYSYCWPRDGALVAHALSMAGFGEVSRRFFEFCKKVIREDGCFLHKYNPDGTLASSWHPWYRSGQPELPIQEDETALVVWALWKHFERYRDTEFLTPLYRHLVLNAGDFLVRHRDSATKLPLPSHDLWEERYGVHLFTIAAVVGGLRAAANFARTFDDVTNARRYAAAADEVIEGLGHFFWHEEERRFARMGTRNERGYTLDMCTDASAYGLFAFGALPANDPRVVAMMEAVRERLTVRTPVGGVARYENDHYHRVADDSSKVPGNPWFICTLWLAQFEIARATSIDELQRETLPILEWVCDHCLPTGILAEQVHPFDNRPISVSPLTWSHATYVTTVLQYAEKHRRLSTPHRRANDTRIPIA